MSLSSLSFPLKIGTRASPLALAQAHETRARLMAALEKPEDAFEIVAMTTTGDKIQDRTLSEAGGKGLFTKELEEGLLSGSIDLAVHSTKDMPTLLPEGLELAAYLPREDVRDAFISLDGKTLHSLEAGSVVGTASLRRAAMIRHLRPDLEVIPFRGNVQSRLRILAESEVLATLLAEAGLNRLKMSDLQRQTLEPSQFVPAVGQGAVCIEIRSGRDDVRAALSLIHCEATEIAVEAERAMLAMLDGSCHTPIAAYTTLEGDKLSLQGVVLSIDGVQKLTVSLDAILGEERVDDAVALGVAVGEALLDKGAEHLIGAPERDHW